MEETGKLEQLLFRNTRQEITKLLGIHDVAELVNKTRIEIPQPVFSYARDAITKTGLDSKERAAIFGIRNDEIGIVSEQLGSEYSISRGGANVQSDNLLKIFWDIHFAKPALIVFHNHPSFSAEYLEERGVSQVQRPFGMLNSEQLAAMMNFTAKYFSSGDLRRAENRFRYTRSMLLGTANGFTWMVNPNFKLPLFDETFHSDEYAKRFQELVDKEEQRMVQQNASLVDDSGFGSELDQLLKAFCDKRGFLVFRNNNPDDSVLERF